MQRCVARSPARPSGGEGATAFEVAERESPHVQERLAEVVRDAEDGAGTPALPLEAHENRVPDVSAKQKHRLVRGQHDAHALRANALLVLTQGGVVGG